jgi:hypothetical protein
VSFSSITGSFFFYRHGLAQLSLLYVWRFEAALLLCGGGLMPESLAPLGLVSQVEVMPGVAWHCDSI